MLGTETANEGAVKHEGGILTKLCRAIWWGIGVLCMDFGKVGMEEGGLDSFVPNTATPGYKARVHDNIKK